MALGTLQAFIDSFQNSARFQREQNAQSRETAALAARGRSYLGDTGVPSPGTQGPAPTGGAPGSPPMADMSGADHPLAGLQKLIEHAQGGMQGPPQPPPTGQMQSPSAPGQAPGLAPGGVAALAQATQIKPAPPRFPDPTLSATAQPPAPGGGGLGGGEGMSAIQDAQQNIQSIASDIKAKNPNIDPVTLAMAVDQQVETIKGVAPLTKATMQYQIQTIRQQQNWTIAQQKIAQIDEQTHIRYMQAKTAEERVQVLREGNQLRHQAMEDAIDSREGIAADNNHSREGIAADNRTSREGMNADNIDGRESVAGINQDTREYSADQGFRGAQTRAGGKVDPAPQRPPRRPRVRLQEGAAPRGGAPKFVEGHVYTDANGNSMRYTKGGWVKP